MISEHPKNSFVKEVLLALLILGNCLILPLHLLVGDELNAIKILGYTYVHGYLSNQAFVWILICHFQILTYSLIFLIHSERRYRHSLFLVIYWITYNTLISFTPQSILEEARVVLLFSALAVTMMLTTALAKKEKRSLWKFKFSKHKFDFSIALVIISMPILERISYTIPLGKSELNIWGYTLTGMGFSDVDSLIAYLFLKLFILIPLLFFFLETKRWWRYTLLFPILLAVFQIKTAFNPNLEHLDVYEFLEAAPFLFLVLVLLLFLSNTAYYQSKMKELYRKTYDHVEEAIQKKFKGREYFLSQTKAKWRKMKNAEDINENELHQLKQRLEQELQKHGS